MNIVRFWRQHKTNVIFGVGTLIAIALSSNDIGRNMQSINSIKQVIASQSEKQALLEQQFQFEQEKSKIAKGRYETGCLPVVAPNRQYISIEEGAVIRDRLTKKPLPNKTIVCDAQGNTGVIGEGGKVDAIAFTGDRDFVAKRLKRFRAGTYSQPIVEEP